MQPATTWSLNIVSIFPSWFTNGPMLIYSVKGMGPIHPLSGVTKFWCWKNGTKRKILRLYLSGPDEQEIDEKDVCPVGVLPVLGFR